MDTQNMFKLADVLLNNKKRIIFVLIERIKRKIFKDNYLKE